MTFRDEVLVLARQARPFRAWKSVEVRRRIDAAADQFRIVAGIASLRAEQGRDVRGFLSRLPIDVGDEIRVGTTLRSSADFERVSTGYVDAIEAVGDESRLELSVEGRSRSADLVDCSAEHESREWLNVRIDDLARALAAPFGVEVVVEAEELGERFERFRLRSGETAWNALERAARLRSILIHSDERGRLLLASAGTAGVVPHEIAEDTSERTTAIPARRWRWRHSNANRFQVYLVRGQGPGSDDAWGAEVALVEARAEDSGVGRYRPLIVVPESSVTFESAKDRARWEASFRAARSTELEVEVVGWHHSGEPRLGQDPEQSELWRVNQLVPFSIPSAGLSGRLLVAEVRFKKDERGMTTRLRLVRPDAYSAQPTVPNTDPLDERLVE
ncbi:MAG: phage baseplate assembly protein [Planctomycetota bacterium]